MAVYELMKVTLPAILAGSCGQPFARFCGRVVCRIDHWLYIIRKDIPVNATETRIGIVAIIYIHTAARISRFDAKVSRA